MRTAIWAIHLSMVGLVFAAGIPADEVGRTLRDNFDLSTWAQMTTVFHSVTLHLHRLDKYTPRSLFNCDLSITSIGMVGSGKDSLLEAVTGVSIPKDAPIPINIYFSYSIIPNITIVLHQYDFRGPWDTILYSKSGPAYGTFPDVASAVQRALFACKAIEPEVHDYVAAFPCILEVQVQGPDIPTLNIISIPPLLRRGEDNDPRSYAHQRSLSRDRGVRREVGWLSFHLSGVVLDVIDSDAKYLGSHAMANVQTALAECEEPACKIFSVVARLEPETQLKDVLPSGYLEATNRKQAQDRNGWFAVATESDGDNEVGHGEPWASLPGHRLGAAAIRRHIAAVFREKIYAILPHRIGYIENKVESMDRMLEYWQVASPPTRSDTPETDDAESQKAKNWEEARKELLTGLDVLYELWYQYSKGSPPCRYAKWRFHFYWDEYEPVSGDCPANGFWYQPTCELLQAEQPTAKSLREAQQHQ